MVRSKSLVYSMFAIFFVVFLWGGEIGAYAANNAWVKYADGTLTFLYGEKSSLGTDEYWLNQLNEYNQRPCWFEKDEDITKVVFDKSFADARPKTCRNWFRDFSNLKAIEGIGYLNTSNVTDMRFMFDNCSSLTSLDVSKFNTSNVKDMGSMFSGCKSLTSLDLSKLITYNVEDMASMFSYCESLTTLDLCNFNTMNVQYMEDMFYGCVRLTTIYVSSNFVRHTTRGYGMFQGCEMLVGDIAYDENRDKTNDMDYATPEGGYFTHKEYTRPWVKYADGTLTFRYGYKKELGTDEYVLKTGSYLKTDWSGKSQDVTKVVFDPSFARARPTTCSTWFKNFNRLTTIEGIENLNTSNTTDMYDMFFRCSGLSTLDLSGFNTSKVTDMRRMFYECPGLTTIYASGKFVTSGVSQPGMGADMFKGCTKLVGDIAYDASKTDKNYATVDGGYFTDKYARPWVKYADGTLTFLYGSKKELGTDEYGLNEGRAAPGWNEKKDVVTKVVFDPSFAQARPTSCYLWFDGFQKLMTIEGIGNLNTTDVTNMVSMFYGCLGLTSLDVSKFNTSKVTDMASMFYHCSGLTSLDLSKFDTHNVTSMISMFFYCECLTSLDVSKFNTSKVTNMAGMFFRCKSLTSLDVSNFETQNVTDMSYMFGSCSGLTSLDVSKFNTMVVFRAL